MRKLKIYFDTSIFNFVFEEEDVVKKMITLKLFSQIQNFDVYISELVLVEINEASEPLKSRLLNLINEYAPSLLEINTEISSLADRYIKEGIIPAKYQDDALHIAVAVVNEMDVILSWNFQHIVKLKTKLKVNGINKLLGYKEIQICSPEEVVE
jgi:predicted nucleic acid-binding protein